MFTNHFCPSSPLISSTSIIITITSPLLLSSLPLQHSPSTALFLLRGINLNTVIISPAAFAFHQLFRILFPPDFRPGPPLTIGIQLRSQASQVRSGLAGNSHQVQAWFAGQAFRELTGQALIQAGRPGLGQGPGRAAGRAGLRHRAGQAGPGQAGHYRPTI